MKKRKGKRNGMIRYDVIPHARSAHSSGRFMERRVCMVVSPWTRPREHSSPSLQPPPSRGPFRAPADVHCSGGGRGKTSANNKKVQHHNAAAPCRPVTDQSCRVSPVCNLFSLLLLRVPFLFLFRPLTLIIAFALAFSSQNHDLQ